MVKSYRWGGGVVGWGGVGWWGGVVAYVILVSPPVPIGLGFFISLGLGLGLGLGGLDLGLGLDNKSAVSEHSESTQGALREHSEHQNKSQYSRSL